MIQDALKPILGLFLSYLLGAVPTGYIFGRLKGIDIRRHGSGNPGATNVLRVLGKRAASAVLILDIAKGTLAVILAARFFSAPNVIARNLFLCLSAVCAVSGHNWTIFLNFKGGKGVATSLGVLIAFAVIIERFAWVILTVVLAWLIVFLLSGFVSLASIAASVMLPVMAVIFRLPKEIAALLFTLAAFSLIRHNSNISRLLQKKESRFDTKSFLRKLTGKTLSQ